MFGASQGKGAYEVNQSQEGHKKSISGVNEYTSSDTS
jgi:hypothetical protein